MKRDTPPINEERKNKKTFLTNSNEPSLNNETKYKYKFYINYIYILPIVEQEIIVFKLTRSSKNQQI